MSLDPLLRERSELYRRWVASGLRSDYLAFADARRQARGAVRSAKENWIASHAAFVESVRFSGRHAWSAVREIRRCLAGLPPRPICSIKDENGNPCLSRDSQTARWHHFTRVLNLPSQFDEDVVQSIPQSEPALFHDPPSEDRLCCALRSMASGKAGGGGLSEIVPELLKAGGLPLRGALLDMFRSVWSASYAPMDWRHAQIVLVPKKGDLSLCDNWRGSQGQVSVRLHSGACMCYCCYYLTGPSR